MIALRPVMQKAPRFESRKLLDLAHDMPCMFTFGHQCFGDVVACHANWLLWGKGVGKKVSDWAFAAGCMTAHDIIDRRVPSDMDEEMLQQEWMRAFISTHDYLWREKRIKVA